MKAMPIPTNAPTINVIGNVKLDIDTPKIGNSLTSETILVLKTRIHHRLY